MKYSGLEALERPEIRLIFDLSKERWSLPSLRRVDKKGKIILEKGNAGTCAELALYANEELQLQLKDKFDSKIIRVAEASYFPPSYGVHFALLIHSKSADRTVHLYDPSLKRLIPLDEADQYEIYRQIPAWHLTLPSELNFNGNLKTQIPLLIHNKAIITMGPEPVGNLLNKDNFALTVFSKRENAFRARPLLKVGKRDGKTFQWSNKNLPKKILTSAQIQRLQIILTKLTSQADFQNSRPNAPSTKR